MKGIIGKLLTISLKIKNSVEGVIDFFDWSAKVLNYCYKEKEKYLINHIN